MTTFLDLQDTVLNALHSGTVDQEQRCALTQAIDTDDLTFTVDDAAQLSRGLIEIDSELLWVKSTDAASGTVTLAPFGRGYGTSTAAAHAEDAMVVNTPRYPRAYVQSAIKETLNGLYPELYQVATVEAAAGAATVTYDLASTAGWVVRVEWEAIGPSGSWVPVSRWRFDANADPGDYSGKTIDIFDSVTPGRTIRVTYAAPLGTFTSDADTLATVGLDEGSADLLVFGACARLLQSMEGARLQPGAIEQQHHAQLTQPGSATNAAKGYWALYQLRLDEQRSRLQRLYPVATHFSR